MSQCFERSSLPETSSQVLLASSQADMGEGHIICRKMQGTGGTAVVGMPRCKLGQHRSAISRTDCKQHCCACWIWTAEHSTTCAPVCKDIGACSFCASRPHHCAPARMMSAQANSSCAKCVREPLHFALLQRMVAAAGQATAAELCGGWRWTHWYVFFLLPDPMLCDFSGVSPLQISSYDDMTLDPDLAAEQAPLMHTAHLTTAACRCCIMSTAAWLSISNTAIASALASRTLLLSCGTGAAPRHIPAFPSKDALFYLHKCVMRASVYLR